MLSRMKSANDLIDTEQKRTMLWEVITEVIVFIH